MDTSDHESTTRGANQYDESEGSIMFESDDGSSHAGSLCPPPHHRLYSMDNAFEVQTPVLESELKRWDLDDTEQTFKKVPSIGSLLYLMHGTRLDLAYPVIPI